MQSPLCKEVKHIPHHSTPLAKKLFQWPKAPLPTGNSLQLAETTSRYIPPVIQQFLQPNQTTFTWKRQLHSRPCLCSTGSLAEQDNSLLAWGPLEASLQRKRCLKTPFQSTMENMSEDPFQSTPEKTPQRTKCSRPQAWGVKYPGTDLTTELTLDPAVDTTLLALIVFMPQWILITDVQYSGQWRDRGSTPTSTRSCRRLGLALPRDLTGKHELNILS